MAIQVFITGGLGFLGTAVTETFLDAGYSVTSFDANTVSVETKVRFKRAIADGRIIFLQGDIGDRERVEELVADSGPGPIIHLAGILTTGCDLNPRLALEVNLHGTRNLFEAAIRRNGGRVVLASTISVYGRDLPQPIDESMATDPDAFQKPALHPGQR